MSRRSEKQLAEKRKRTLEERDSEMEMRRKAEQIERQEKVQAKVNNLSDHLGLDIPPKKAEAGNQYDFTDAEIIACFSHLMQNLAQKNHPIHERSDWRPFMVGDTGVRYEKNPDGDPDCIGFAFVVDGARDNDTNEPFVTGVKIPKEGFNHNPRLVAVKTVLGLAKGMGMMKEEAERTAEAQVDRLRALGMRLN